MTVKNGLKKTTAELKKARSCAHPLLALSEALELAKKIYDNFGAGPHAREAAARGLGYASFSGAASGKIGALVHFGLLSRSSGLYLITPLAKEAFSYPNEGSLEAIARAAVKPVLYRSLAARFSGGPLPNELAAILAADYKITSKAAPAAGENYIKTMEFAGLIKGGSLVLTDAAEPAAGLLKFSEIGFGKENDKNRESASGAIKIKLVSGVEIIFPQDLAYRISMGEFADDIRNLDKKAGGVQ